jgi:acetate kinase
VKILVANLGSTSFKYRLFEMAGASAEQLAEGGFERVTEYVPCIEEMLETLMGDGIIASGEDLDGIGFKTVLGKDLSGCVPADDRVLAALNASCRMSPGWPSSRRPSTSGYPPHRPSTPSRRHGGTLESGATDSTGPATSSSLNGRPS